MRPESPEHVLDEIAKCHLKIRRGSPENESAASCSDVRGIDMFCSGFRVGSGAARESARSVETRIAASSLPGDIPARGLGCPSPHRSIVRLWRSRRRLPRVALEPALELLQGKFTLQSMTLFAVANFAVESGQQVEGYIRRLEVLALRPRDVVNERTQCRGARRRYWVGAICHCYRIYSRHQARRDRFHVAFDSADLPRKQHMGVCLH